MPALVVAGVLELACGVLSGWAMVYAGTRRRGPVVDPRRIRQGHLDLLMMGTILVAVGAALPDPPALAVVLVIAGSWLAPLLFFPLAVRPALGERPWYEALDRAGFVALSVGWIALAVEVLGR